MGGTDGIEHKPSSYGTKTMIAGTRVRVLDIAQLYQIELDELIMERIGDALPHLTPDQILTALTYWREHKDEIEGEIRAEAEIMAKIPPAW